jgi:hypothetical protein
MIVAARVDARLVAVLRRASTAFDVAENAGARRRELAWPFVIETRHRAEEPDERYEPEDLSKQAASESGQRLKWPPDRPHHIARLMRRMSTLNNGNFRRVARDLARPPEAVLLDRRVRPAVGLRRRL